MNLAALQRMANGQSPLILPPQQQDTQRLSEFTLIEDVPGLGLKGQKVKLTMYPEDVQGTTMILETLVVGFSQPGFRGEEACPEYLVDTNTGKYQVYNLNNVARLVNVISSPQAAIPEIDVERSWAEYYLVERALGGFVPAVTQWHVDKGLATFDVKSELALTIRAKLLLDHEVRVWSTYTTSGSWNAANRETLGAGVEWTNANGKPITNLNARLNASAQPVTDIWFNPLVAQAFLSNPETRDYIKYVKGDTPTPSEIIQAQQNTHENLDFRIAGYPPFHVVAGKVYNETTGNLDWILNDTTVLTSNPPGAGTRKDAIMTARTMRRRGPNGTGYQVIDVPIPPGERGFHGGSFLAAGNADQVVMISGVVGGAIFNCLA